MTSSNGNIFRVTGPLRGEFTGPGEFPAHRPVPRSFDVFFDFSLNKRLSKQSWGWWSETPPRSLWRQCNVHVIKLVPKFTHMGCPLLCIDYFTHVLQVYFTGTRAIRLPWCPWSDSKEYKETNDLNSSTFMYEGEIRMFTCFRVFNYAPCINFVVVLLTYKMDLTAINKLIFLFHVYGCGLFSISRTVMMTSSNGSIFRVTGLLRHRSPVNSPHKGLWHGAWLFSFICAWIYRWIPRTNGSNAENISIWWRHHVKVSDIWGPIQFTSDINLRVITIAGFTSVL